MSELRSALSVALETSLPARIASGETSVDQFLNEEGFSVAAIKTEIDTVTRSHNHWKTRFKQRDSSSWAVFGDQQVLAEMLAFLDAQDGDGSISVSAGGTGWNAGGIKAASMRSNHLQANRVTDQFRFERADSLAESNQAEALSKHCETSQSETSSHGVKQEYSTHSKLITDYFDLYALGRQYISKATLNTLKVDVAKRYVHLQLHNFMAAFDAHLTGRHNWTYTRKWQGDDNGVDYIGAGASYGHKKTSTNLTVENFSPGDKTGSNNIVYLGENGQNPMIISNRADGYVIDVQFSDKKWDNEYNIYTSGDSVVINQQAFKGSKEKEDESVSISFNEIVERSKALQRDKAIVQAYKQGDLIPESVKLRFGKILALSAIAYNIKRMVTVEKKLWPSTYSTLIARTEDDGWGKAYQTNYNKTVGHQKPVFNKDQKEDARKLEYLDDSEITANATVKLASLNAERVYKRSISEGISKGASMKIADLTYISDIVLFDSFLNSSALGRLSSSSNVLNRVTGGMFSEMSYALMPVVIQRQIQISRHILNIERTDIHYPRLAHTLLKEDLYKNECLTKALNYETNEFSQYLGFHPVHRTLRFTKNSLKTANNFLEKYFGAPWLDDLVNASIDVVSRITKTLIHMPEKMAKDGYKLFRQQWKLYTNIFTGQFSLKGTLDAIGRDTKGPRHMIKLINTNISGFNRQGESALLVDYNLGKSMYVGIDALFHKSAIKRDKRIAKAEMSLHSSLHKTYPNLIKSPDQLIEKNYNKADEEAKSMLMSDIDSILTTDAKLIYPKIVNTFQEEKHSVWTFLGSLKTFIGSLMTFAGNHDISGKEMKGAYIIINRAYSKRFANPLGATVKKQIEKKAEKKLDIYLETKIKEMNSALNTQFSNSLSSKKVQKEMSRYLEKNSIAVRNTLKTINQRQHLRFQRQLKALKLQHKYGNFLLKHIEGGIDLFRFSTDVKELLKFEKASFLSQINEEWNANWSTEHDTEGGAYEFHKFFVNPYKWTLSNGVLPKDTVLGKYVVKKKLGERLFGAILIGDYVHRLITNPTFMADGEELHRRINTFAFGPAILRLVFPQMRRTISRISFILHIGSLKVSKKSLSNLRNNIISEAKRINSSGFENFLDNHHKIKKTEKKKDQTQLAWYQKNRKDHEFKNHWQKRIGSLANNHNQVALNWQSDVKGIKDGNTMTVGQIINSLEPAPQHWGLSLTYPPQQENGASGGSSNSSPKTNSSDNTNNQPVDSKRSVSLLFFYAKSRLITKLIMGKNEKKDLAKKEVKKEAQDDVATEESDLISGAEKDIATDSEAMADEVGEEVVAADDVLIDVAML